MNYVYIFNFTSMITMSSINIVSVNYMNVLDLYLLLITEKKRPGLSGISGFFSTLLTTINYSNLS